MYCNYSGNQPITWIKSVDKKIVYVIQNDARTIISNNGLQLTISNLFLSDQQYYACGYTNNAVLVALNQYFLFIRGILLKLF